jgi:hypothetical protein
VGGALFGAGTAFATTGHHGKTVSELTKLEDLRGLPCNVGTPDEGTLDFRYFNPTITFYCLNDNNSPEAGAGLPGLSDGGRPLSPSLPG